MLIYKVISCESKSLANVFLESVRPFTWNLTIEPATKDERRFYCEADYAGNAWTIADRGEDCHDDIAEFPEPNDARSRGIAHNRRLHYYWLVFYAGYRANY